ncbi:unnamed protein product [Sphagnum jensenii]
MRLKQAEIQSYEYCRSMNSLGSAGVSNTRDDGHFGLQSCSSLVQASSEKIPRVAEVELAQGIFFSRLVRTVAKSNSSSSISMMENKSLKSVQSSSSGAAGPSQSASTSSSRRPGVRLSAMHAAELICLVDDM